MDEFEDHEEWGEMTLSFINIRDSSHLDVMTLSCSPQRSEGYNVEQAVNNLLTTPSTPEGLPLVLGQAHGTTAVYRPESRLNPGVKSDTFVGHNDAVQQGKMVSSEKEGQSVSPTNSPSSPLEVGDDRPGLVEMTATEPSSGSGRGQTPGKHEIDTNDNSTNLPSP